MGLKLKDASPICYLWKNVVKYDIINTLFIIHAVIGYKARKKVMIIPIERD